MPRALRQMDKRFFKANAKDATFHTFTNAGDDAYGSPVWTDTQTTVKGILSFSRRSVRIVAEATGIQYMIEAELYVQDEDFATVPGMTAPLDPDNGRKPYVTIGSAEYDIFEAEQPGIGITRMICIKRRVT